MVLSVVRLGIFTISDLRVKVFGFFISEYDVSCGLVIFEVHLLYTHFVESFRIKIH